MDKYEAHIERDGTFWLITIPELDGATQARTRDEIDPMTRDYIRIITGNDNFAVIYNEDVSPSV